MTARPPAPMAFALGAAAALAITWTTVTAMHPRGEPSTLPPTYAGAIPVRAGLPFALHDGGINAVCVVDHSAYAMPPLFQRGG